MTREEKIQALVDYFAWVDSQAQFIMTRGQALEAYAEHLELEELRERG